MSIHPKYLAPFVEEKFYHVYNRTNGSHKLCRDQENYKYFIKSFEEFMCTVADIYSYSVMPSHFHSIVKVKRLEQLQELMSKRRIQIPDINKIVVKQFQAFFTSYTMSFNVYHERQGALFNHRFRRIAIENNDQLRETVFYVHSNPVHHSLTKSFVEYPWTSYPVILSEEPTKIKREEVLELFGGREEFIKFHEHHRPISTPTRF